MDDETESSDDPIVRRMLRNWKQSVEAEQENRDRGLKALKFRRGGKDQWDTKVYNFFGDQNKPRESFNQIPQFVHQVTNDMRMNMPQIRIAAGDDGDDQTAEVAEDLLREIQSTSEAEVAYDTAVDSQVTIGWGYWRFITKYANSKTKNQNIAIRWIPNPFQVYDDPNAMMQDFSDRKYLVQVEDIALEDFNDEYEKKYDAEKLQSIGDASPQWATDKTVRIAEYWEVRNGKKSIYFDDDGALSEKETKDKREVDEPKVMWYKATASEILDSRKWPGCYIPYVRVSGETLYIDGKVLYLGLVDGLMAPQTQFNYWMNSATYMVSMAPIAPFILDPQQIEGYQQFWDQANIKAYPFLPARRFDANGKDLGVPQRSNSSVDIGNMMALVQQAQQNLYNCSGIHQASLGEPSNEKSGKAILARQKEGDVSNFHFQDNNARGQRFGGRIFVDLYPKIYDAPRTITARKEDKTSYKVKINQPHTDENGIEKHIDFSKGEYSVSVTTGPSYSTRKAEAADQAGQLIQSFPQIMQTAAGPQLVRSMDLVDADMIADGLERSLPPQLQTPPDMKKLPPQVQAMAQQAQSQIQQLQQQLQQSQQIIQQGTQEIQQLQAEAGNKQADSQSKLQDAQSRQADAQRKHDFDLISLQQKQHEFEHQMQMDAADIALRNRALDIQELTLGIKVDQAQSDAEQAAIDNVIEQGHDLNMQDADQYHDHALAVTNAMLQPQPVDNPTDSADNNGSSGA